jgi:hypothetical protein
LADIPLTLGRGEKTLLVDFMANAARLSKNRTKRVTKTIKAAWSSLGPRDCRIGFDGLKPRSRRLMPRRLKREIVFVLLGKTSVRSYSPFKEDHERNNQTIFSNEVVDASYGLGTTKREAV